MPSEERILGVGLVKAPWPPPKGTKVCPKCGCIYANRVKQFYLITEPRWSYVHYGLDMKPVRECLMESYGDRKDFKRAATVEPTQRRKHESKTGT